MMHRFVSASFAAALLAGCSADLPQGSTPYAPTAAMRAVLVERQAMHAKAPPHVALDEARDVPTLEEAAQAIENVAGLPAPSIDIADVTAPIASGAAGPIGARLYRPTLANNTPIIIYFPGGTWATRSDVSSDETARELASRTGWVVLSLRPRLAPEAQFPAIHDDAMATYQWARTQMVSWGADPTRVVLAGEGPGANLALATALQARDQRVPMPDQLLLITPWLGTATHTASMSENSGSQPLTRSTVRWAQDLYADDHLDDPRIDLAARNDFAGLPPTTVVLAEIDPLRSGAEMVAERMRAQGVRTEIRLYRGVTYDFFGLGTSVPEAATAEIDVARSLRAGFPARLAVSRSTVAGGRKPIRQRARRRPQVSTSPAPR